jgi:hypothetical protein
MVIGCQGKGPKSLVRGKVTLEGQPVAGQIVIIGSDNKEKSAPLAMGQYSIENPPSGEVTIVVKGLGPGMSLGGKLEGIKTKEKGAPAGAAASPDMGVEPPAKYGKKEGGIKKTIKGSGVEVMDIELTR